MKTPTKLLAKAQKDKIVKKTNSSEYNITKGNWSFDKDGKIKPIKKMAEGGKADEECWPGKPGCGHKRAQRVNSRRAAANKVGPVLKKIGTAVGSVAAGALAYTKNIGGIKDKIQNLKEQKKGGSVKTKRSVGSITKRKK